MSQFPQLLDDKLGMFCFFASNPQYISYNRYVLLVKNFSKIKPIVQICFFFTAACNHNWINKRNVTYRANHSWIYLCLINIIMFHLKIAKKFFFWFFIFSISKMLTKGYFLSKEKESFILFKVKKKSKSFFFLYLFFKKIN